MSTETERRQSPQVGDGDREHLPPPPSRPVSTLPPPPARSVPPPPPASLSIPSAAPDHWWSRKPKEERRPLGSRLLRNFWEFRHPGKVLAAAFLAVVLVGSVMALATAIGSNGADDTTAATVPDAATPEDEGAASDEAPDQLPFGADIPAGAAFSGQIKGDPTVQGDVSFEISSTGDAVESFEAAFDFNDYQCPDSATVLSAEITITHTPAAPIIADGFEIEGSFAVEGQFESTTSASGTVSADLEFLPGGCEVGPFEWTATAG